MYESYSKFFMRKFGVGFIWGLGLSSFLTAQFAIMMYIMKRGMIFSADLISQPIIWSSVLGWGFGLYSVFSSNYRKPPRVEETITKNV